MKQGESNRREFVAVLAGALVASMGLSRQQQPHLGHTTHGGHGTDGGHRVHLGPHPDPRPDVDASHVLTADQLSMTPDVIDLYDGIRQIPEIADGIRCQCGCADLPDYRSLLTCFEGGGMAMYCEICQGEGRMVVRLHAAGRTLEQIREAVDARYGF